ncbi:MAG: response regulator [Phaeodactylibacter sp.]|nr:response regulator [Phaeodactylibacter sp.]MCB9272666.1 response regulator [Lewinellaceae bacterium]
MTNILIITNSDEKTAASLCAAFTGYIHNTGRKARVLWSNGLEAAFAEYTHDGFRETGGVLSDMEFLFTFRHGSNHVDERIKPLIRAKEKYVFGGAGYGYIMDPYFEAYGGGIPLIRRINEASPVEEWEVEELFRHAERKDARQHSGILYYEAYEKRLKDQYAVLANGPIQGILGSREFWNGPAGKKALVIWNDSITALPAGQSGQCDLLTPETLSYIGENISFEAQVDTESYFAIIICAELNLKMKKWKEGTGASAPLQAGVGLQVARDLRLLRYRQPIIICSLQTEKDVRSRDPYDILATPGHYFFSLGKKQYDISLPETARALFEFTLEDIIEFQLTQGKFREAFHKMEGDVALASGAEVLTNIVETGFETLKRFFASQYIKNFAKVEAIKADILENIIAIAAGRDGSAKKQECVRGRKEALRKLLAPKDSPGLSETPKGWDSVIYIEDHYVQQETVKGYFLKAGIDCIAVTSGTEAIALLRKLEREQEQLEGGRTLPPVIITDWRLLSPNGDWQEQQGLDIIYEIATTPGIFSRPLSFFMLTDKVGGILDMAKRSFPFQVRWYAKRDVNRSEADAVEFVNDVIRQGNRMWDSWAGLPSERWNSPLYSVDAQTGKPKNVTFHYSLKTYFRQYLIQHNYRQQRAIINASAIELLTNARLVHHGILDEIPEEFRPVFLSKLTNRSADEDLDKFYPKLVGRRVFIALSQDGYNKKEVFSLLFKGCSYKTLKHELEITQPDGGAQNAIKTKLANFRTFAANHLAIVDGNSVMLQEERTWLYELKKQQENSERRIAALFKALQEGLFKIVKTSDPAAMIMQRARFAGLFLPVALNQGKSFLETVSSLTDLKEFSDAKPLWQNVVHEIGKNKVLSCFLVNDYYNLVRYCQENVEED